MKVSGREVSSYINLVNKSMRERQNEFFDISQEFKKFRFQWNLAEVKEKTLHITILNSISEAFFALFQIL
jgi:hypothetical protein